MPDIKKPEEIAAETIQNFLKIVGVDELRDSLIKQVSYRIGTKLNNKYENDFRNALKKVNIVPSSKYSIAKIDMIKFDVDDIGTAGGVTVKPIFNFDLHLVEFKKINKDLFTVVEDVLMPVLGKSSSQNIKTPAGFQYMHDIIKEFLDGFISGKFKDNVTEVNYFKRVCNGARAIILGTDATVNIGNVLKYQKYLKKEEALIPFQSIEGVSSDARIVFEIPYLADKAINIIMKNGFTYEESVGIYNVRFGCNYEPYTGNGIVCCICHKTNIFFAKIKNTENCSDCGQPLFRKCNKDGCNTIIPRVIDACPQCGFRESDIKYYDNIISTAKVLAEKGLIEKADEYLAIAQTAVPNRKTELNNIQNIINNEKANRQKIINEIELLINSKNFYAAKGKLVNAKKILPYEILEKIETQIINAINSAEKLFSSVGDSMQQLQRVLSICADHTEAIKYRDMIPPKAPSQLGSPFVNTNNHIQVSWSPSPDIDIEYCLIRKKDSPPTSVSDGDKIAQTENLDATDTSPIPGNIYYAVFTKRGKRYSSEFACSSIKYLPTVSYFKIKPLKDKKTELSYNIPQGASGVKIERISNNGKIDIVYEGSKTIAIDSSQTQICTYTIKVIYDDKMESKEKKQFFNIDTLPKEIKPQINSENNNIKITWNTTQIGYTVKIINTDKTQNSIEEGNFCSENELGLKANELASVYCEDFFVDFNVETNKQYYLAVLIGNQNGYLCCGVFPVYSGKFPKLRQIPNDVDIHGNHYFSFEHSLTNEWIYYAITKQNNTAPDNDKFKLENVIDKDGDGRPVVKIQNQNHTYIGKYYFCCKYRLINDTWSDFIWSNIHFRQEVRIVFKLKQSGTILTANLYVNLINYDFESYPELPQLNFLIDGIEYPIKRRNVYINNRSFRTTETIQLRTPIKNLSDVKLIPADKAFISDFITYSQTLEV